MTTTIRKWGNSLGLRLPKDIADQMEIKDGTNITIKLNEGTLEITKLQEDIELDSLLLRITEDNLHTEFVDLAPIGNEIW